MSAFLLIAMDGLAAFSVTTAQQFETDLYEHNFALVPGCESPYVAVPSSDTFN